MHNNKHFFFVECNVFRFRFASSSAVSSATGLWRHLLAKWCVSTCGLVHVVANRQLNINWYVDEPQQQVCVIVTGNGDNKRGACLVLESERWVISQEATTSISLFTCKLNEKFHLHKAARVQLNAGIKWATVALNWHHEVYNRSEWNNCLKLSENCW